MGFAEILLIFVVALLVIRPKQWLTLLKQGAQLFRQFNEVKTQAKDKLEDVLKEATLLDNEKKAQQADKAYEDKSHDA